MHTLGAAGLVLGSSTARADIPSRVVALTSADAPGIAGAQLTSIREYYLAGRGQLVFEGDTNAAAAAGRAGFFAYAGGAVELVASNQDAVPGGEGLLSFAGSAVRGPFVNDAGVVSMGVSTTQPSLSVLLRGTRGALRLADWQTPAELDPTTLGFVPLQELRPSSGGALGFTIGLPSTSGGLTVAVDDGAAVEILAREGDPAPGFDLQFFETGSGFTLLNASDSGRLAFRARRTGAADDERTAIWSGSNGSDVKLELAFADLQAAEGAPLRSESGFFWYAADAVWFVTERGFWVSRDGAVSLFRAAPDQTWFFGFSANSLPAFSRSGRRVVFPSEWLGLSAEAPCEGTTLWAGPVDAPVPIARTGAPLRGAADVLFESAGWMQVNEAGHVVLELELRRASDGAAVNGLYRYAPGVGFEPVVAPDSVVGEGDARRAVTDYSLDCGLPSYALGGIVDASLATESCFDEDGRVAFVASFSDGTSGLVLTEPAGTGGDPGPLASELAACATVGGAATAPDDGDEGGAPDAGGAGGEAPVIPGSSPRPNLDDPPTATPEGGADGAGSEPSTPDPGGGMASSSSGCSVSPPGPGESKRLSPHAFGVFALLAARRRARSRQ